MANYSNLKSNSEVKQRSYITIIMNKIIMLLLFLMIVSMAFPGLSPAENHTAESSGTKMSMESDKQDMNEMKMDMSACKRMVELTNEAEHQLGGAQYTGKMPMKGMAMKMSMDSKKGMKMKMDSKDEGTKMKMDSKDEGMKMKMDSKDVGMHQDHDAKAGGSFFMAPNEMHHIEGTYSKDCGFQLFLFNAFTKPIKVDRFRALIKVSGEIDEEDVEFSRFLSPNKMNSFLQAPLMKGLNPPFEIELNVKFPESEKVESFNFEVDKDGKIS